MYCTTFVCVVCVRDAGTAISRASERAQLTSACDEEVARSLVILGSRHSWRWVTWCIAQLRRAEVRYAGHCNRNDGTTIRLLIIKPTFGVLELLFVSWHFVLIGKLWDWCLHEVQINIFAASAKVCCKHVLQTTSIIAETINLLSNCAILNIHTFL